MLDDLSLAQYRFTLSLAEQAQLPKYKGAMLRGVLGYSLKQVCWPDCHTFASCQFCLLNLVCPYGYLFETSYRSRPDANPANWPRPYILKPPLDGITQYDAGEDLSFDVMLVGRAIDYLPYLLAAFAGAESVGLGKGFARYTVERVEVVHPLTNETALVFADSQWVGADRQWVLRFPQLCEMVLHLPADEVGLTHITPTCLKLTRRTRRFSRVNRDGLAEEPAFPVLVGNLLTRIAMMYRVHCGQIWTDSREELLSAAERIHSDCQTHWVEWTRTSTKQDRDIDYGGFLGRVTYSGNLKPFMPFLLLGSLIHVGQKCDAGNGWYRMNL